MFRQGSRFGGYYNSPDEMIIVWIRLVAAEGVRSGRGCMYLLMNSLWGVRCRE